MTNVYIYDHGYKSLVFSSAKKLWQHVIKNHPSHVIFNGPSTAAKDLDVNIFVKTIENFGQVFVYDEQNHQDEIELVSRPLN